MAILVVDDSLAMRKVIRNALEGTGLSSADILEAASGADAFRILETQRDKVRLVLLDWIMPELDGMEVLRRIRATPIWRSIPVIMISSQAQQELIVQAVREGARNYVVKPFRPETLVRKVREALPDLPEPPSGKRPLTVLIVDDSDTMRKVIRTSLAEIDGFVWTFVEAADGLEALNSLRTQDPPVDLVLADWEMPNMDGMELLRQMRGSGAFAKIPFIMISSASRRERVIEAVREGARGFLVKPFRPESLRVKIAEVMKEDAGDPPSSSRVSDTMIVRRELGHVGRPDDPDAPFFDRLPLELREAVRLQATQRAWSAGQEVVRAGAIVGELHVVQAGEVEVLTGGGQPADIRGAGECVGEESFLSGDPSPHTARARSPVVTLTIERGAFDRLLDLHPVLGDHLSRLYSPPA